MNEPAPFVNEIAFGDLWGERRNNTAYHMYIGWCMAKKIHYTEVWNPEHVREFQVKYNEEVQRRRRL